MSTPDARSQENDALERVCALALNGESVAPLCRRELEAALGELQETFGELERRESELRQKLETLESSWSEVQDQCLRYRELFEYAPDAYLVTDPAGTIEEANYTATLLFGRIKTFLVGKPLPFFIAIEDRRAFYRRLAALHGSRGPLDAWEARLVPARGKGPPPVVALTATFVIDDRQQRQGLRWLLRDVTAQKKTEESLRAALAFADGLLEGAQALVLAIDVDGRLLRANTYVEEVTGRLREELAGRAWQALLFDDSNPPAAIRDVFITGQAARSTHPLRTRGGGRRSVAWSVRPLRGAEDQVFAVLAIGHDITDLEDAQRKALQLERLAAIGQTAAGLAHESRNALQRGHACLERLHWKLEGQPQALELVERAQKAQNDLLRLYENVRDYAAPFRLQPAPCNPVEVLREVWADLIALAPRRDARLEEDAAPDADGACMADRFSLAQVFRNILENALTACRDPVRIVVAWRGTGAAGRPALRISVRDNGPGLGDEQRRRLFEPFYSTKPKGTGLGLAIVKRIVEAHGGEVAVGDAVAGAEIVIALPRSIT